MIRVRRMVVAVTLPIVLSLLSCSDGDTAQPTAPATKVQVPDDGTGLKAIQDNDPSPDAISVEIDAKETTLTYGTSPPTKVWTYNGTIPGPLIEAKVGDSIKVHFTNHLPEATSIHWHGVRLPASMDGTMLGQDPVNPGESFDYEFTFKDEGLFWFHPHMHTDIQVQMGLYGVIRVRGQNEPAVDDERVVVLDDIKLNPDGTVYDYLDDMSRMMGREGKLILLNGKVTPTQKFLPGSLVRLRLVNAANGRFFNLSAPGVTWRVIGTDGGLIPKPHDQDRLLIAPGERYDVLVRMPSKVGKIQLTDEAYDRGHDSGTAAPLEVATWSIEGETVPQQLAMPETGPSIERLSAGETYFTARLNEKDTPDGVVFTINDQTFPNVPPVNVPDGSVKTYVVKNESEMDHPFHLHGFFFQVVSRNDIPEPADALMNKDTIILPAKQSLKLVTRFDEKGGWVYHCHILEHAELGMVGVINVQ
ncbi:MAG: multicopper oxidase family protein [Polyangiaceae bacterium]